MTFEIAPDSLLGRARIHAPHSGRKIYLMPLAMLVWTFWIFAPPLLYDTSPAHWLWPTLATFGPFLWLYFRTYTTSKAKLLRYALGMAALGFILTPFNWGGQSYIIYACAFLAFTGTSTYSAIRTMLLLVALYMLESTLLGLSWPAMLGMAFMALSIGLMNVMWRRNTEAHAELILSHEEVRRLAATAERERIGRDLHDLLGHTLSLIALKLELSGKLLDRDPEAARQEIGEAEKVAREALREVRAAVTGMRAVGLAAELAAAKLLLESVGIQLRYVWPGWTLQESSEHALALILREAITNVMRHAQASLVEIDFSHDGGQLAMSITDNGHGGVVADGNGLRGMRERLAGLGGEMNITSASVQGTRLNLRFPTDQVWANEAIETADIPSAGRTTAVVGLGRGTGLQAERS